VFFEEPFEVCGGLEADGLDAFVFWDAGVWSHEEPDFPVSVCGDFGECGAEASAGTVAEEPHGVDWFVCRAGGDQESHRGFRQGRVYKGRLGMDLTGTLCRED